MEYHPYYWRSGNTAELDFLFDDRGRIIPMESKAEISTRAKNYLQFCNNYEPELGFRCSMKIFLLLLPGLCLFPLFLMLIFPVRLKDQDHGKDRRAAE